jgi:DNA primase
MKAVDYINEHIDPRKILEYYHFREITESDETIRACCEIHKGNNPTAFMWNKRNNLWYCYTGDCHGGDVYTLIEKMEGVDFMGSVLRAASILNLDIEGMKIEKQSDLIRANTMKWLQFMAKQKEKQEVKPYELAYTKYSDSYETFTRFPRETLSFYRTSFCKVYPTEEMLLYNKLVIPIYFQGVLYGVALRDTSGHAKQKWYYQPDGLQIRHLLYNYDVAMKAIKEHKLNEIILVEGIFDVWAYHEIGIDNVMAVFGSSLKEEQYKTLLKTGKDITTSFDNDKAGQKCTQEVLKKFKNKAELHVIDLPEDHDPADCTPETLRQAYLSRRSYP